jgi:hypothetical protein
MYTYTFTNTYTYRYVLVYVYRHVPVQYRNQNHNQIKCLNRNRLQIFQFRNAGYGTYVYLLSCLLETTFHSLFNSFIYVFAVTVHGVIFWLFFWPLMDLRMTE